MREPDWCTMGYSAHGYSAECDYCGVEVELEFAEGERGYLSFAHRDNFPQDKLFSFVFYWTLQKLEQECTCERYK